MGRESRNSELQRRHADENRGRRDAVAARGLPGRECRDFQKVEKARSRFSPRASTENNTLWTP